MSPVTTKLTSLVGTGLAVVAAGSLVTVSLLAQRTGLSESTGPSIKPRKPSAASSEAIAVLAPPPGAIPGASATLGAAAPTGSAATTVAQAPTAVGQFLQTTVGVAEPFAVPGSVVPADAVASLDDAVPQDPGVILSSADPADRLLAPGGRTFSLAPDAAGTGDDAVAQQDDSQSKRDGSAHGGGKENARRAHPKAAKPSKSKARKGPGGHGRPRSNNPEARAPKGAPRDENRSSKGHPRGRSNRSHGSPSHRRPQPPPAPPAKSHGSPPKPKPKQNAAHGNGNSRKSHGKGHGKSHGKGGGRKSAGKAKRGKAAHGKRGH